MGLESNFILSSPPLLIPYVCILSYILKFKTAEWNTPCLTKRVSCVQQWTLAIASDLTTATAGIPRQIKKSARYEPIPLK